jgi:hypothetical protein
MRLVRFRKTTPKSTPKGWWYTFLGIPLNRSRIDRNGATCQIAAYLLVIVAPIVGLFVQDRGWQVGLSVFWRHRFFGQLWGSST